MLFATGTKEELLQLRDEDAAVFGYPMGITLRRYDVILRGGVYLFPVDVDLLDNVHKLNVSSATLVTLANIEDEPWREGDVIIRHDDEVI